MHRRTIIILLLLGAAINVVVAVTSWKIDIPPLRTQAEVGSAEVAYGDADDADRVIIWSVTRHRVIGSTHWQSVRRLPPYRANLIETGKYKAWFKFLHQKQMPRAELMARLPRWVTFTEPTEAFREQVRTYPDTWPDVDTLPSLDKRDRPPMLSEYRTCILTGLPLRCLWYETTEVSPPRRGFTHSGAWFVKLPGIDRYIAIVPLRIMWFGFAVNTLFYAAILLGIRALFKRWRRRRCSRSLA